jgi:hypothetical protein
MKTLVKGLALSVGVLAGIALLAHAANNWTGTNNAGVATTFCSKDVGGGVEANCVVPVEPTGGVATSGGTPAHYLSAATNNATLVKNAAGVLLGIAIVNTTATAGDFRVYNLATAPVCTSGTAVVWNIPIPANTTAAGVVIPIPNGAYLSAGIGFCYTGVNSDTDNTNAVVGVNINLLYN